MEKKMLSIVIGILIAVLGWSWTTTFAKLVEIEKTLVELRVTVVRLQESIVDRDEVKQIVEDELLKRGIK